MTITTLAGAIAGLRPPQFYNKHWNGSGSLQAETPQSYWGAQTQGFPVAGSVNTTLNGAIYSGSSSQVTGQIPFIDPPNGDNCYLGRWEASLSGNTGKIILADRLWDNGGISITSTSAQTLTSPTWPARDVAGTTNGDGVLLAVELNSPLGASLNSTNFITLSYTNQAGTSGQTATTIPYSNVGGAGDVTLQGQFVQFGLQAGDTGVQSVQSLTLSNSLVSGTINLVAYREIAHIAVDRPLRTFAFDATMGMPQAYAGTVPFLLFQGVTNFSSPGYIAGNIQWTWG